jgi:transposase
MRTTNVAIIGIDLGKNTFHLTGLDQRGAIVLRQKTSRSQLERRLANMPPCLIGMEACAGAHHLGRQLAALGHDVRLIPAQYVRPFVKGHKNDYRDAEAIAEVVGRPTMRFVPLKRVEQLDLQALHRVRSRLVGQRTAVINQIRGFLLEHGITVRQGPAPLRQALPDILAKRTDVLSPRMIRLIEGLADDWRRLDIRIDTVTTEIEVVAKADPDCRRLASSPGVGPIIASAMVAAIGDGSAFARGRDFGAWLGLVPKQFSTGDRTILGGISKRGNRYLRTLFIQGARAVLLRRDNWARHGFGRWLEAAAKRLHRNVLAVALANKLARIAWSVLAKRRGYDPDFVAQAA